MSTPLRQTDSEPSELQTSFFDFLKELSEGQSNSFLHLDWMLEAHSAPGDPEIECEEKDFRYSVSRKTSIAFWNMYIEIKWSDVDVTVSWWGVVWKDERRRW